MVSRNYLVVGFLLCLSLCCSTAVAQPSPRSELLKEIEDLRAQLKLREEAFLSPSEQDRATSAELLRQPETGLIRLLPREEFDGKNKLTIRGGGAYYSFTRLTHEYGFGSDVQLQRGELSVGFAGADYGMLANIGPVPLEGLTLESPGLRFLSEYRPPAAETSARSEYSRFGKGVAEGEVTYKRSLPVKEGTTYVLRSIDYGTSDVLVGLHVLRRDMDGSVIIAWKVLKRYPVPELNKAE